MKTDVFGNELGAEFWFLNFFDIDAKRRGGNFFEIFLDFGDTSTLLTDHGTSFGGTDGNSGEIWATLNYDTIDSWAALETVLDGFANFNVFDEPILEIALAGEPFATPVFADLEAVANWVNFLTHYLLSFSFLSAFLASAFGAAFLTFSSPTTSTKMLDEIFS